MTSFRSLLLFLFTLCALMPAQDFHDADRTSPISVRNGLPSHCTLGQTVINAKATFGQNVYVCDGNAWALVGGAAGDPNSFQVNSGGALGGTKGLTWEHGQLTAGNLRFIGTGLNDGLLWQSSPYTGNAPAVFVVQIDSVGTPDTFKWNKNGGAWTTGVTIPGVDTNLTLSDGVVFYFDSATTGHTLGDKWVITAGSGGQVYSQVEDPAAATVTLSGTPGSVPNGDYAVEYTLVTPDGETYASSRGVTVTDHTTSGQFLISNLQAITDARVIGYNIHIANSADGVFHLVAFVPKGTTSYIFNADPSTFPVSPPTLNNLNTTGPWISGNDGGASRVLQVGDYGVRIPGFANTFVDDAFTSGLSTPGRGAIVVEGGFLSYRQIRGTAQAVQLSSGGTVNHAAVYAADGSLTDGPCILRGTGSPAGVVTAAVGCLYTRTDGGTNTTLYVKESGSGNTGWVAK